MTRNLMAAFVSVLLLATTSSALADETNTYTISKIKTDGEANRFYIDATVNVSCSFSNDTGLTSTNAAQIVDGQGVGLSADLRREAVSLITSAYLAGRQVLLTLRRSNTGGVHCRIIAVELI